MAIKTQEKPLMRQKINVTPTLLEKWKSEYIFDIRQMINPSYLKKEDLGTTFEHEGRTFEIIGMGESRSVMLREVIDEKSFYWECSRQFVQMKLGRFNKYYEKTSDGKTILVEMEYTQSQLLLSPKNTRKKKAESDEIIPNDEIELDEEFSDDEEIETEDNSIF